MRRSPAKLSRVCRGSAAVAVRPASAFYTFDADTSGSSPADATGNGRTATSVVATVFGTPAKVGAKAMTSGSFSVSDTGVSIGATAWTAAAWLRTHTADFDGSGSQVTGNGLFFRVKGNVGGANSQTIQFADNPSGPISPSLTDDTYYHTAMVVSGGNYTAYLNGVVFATGLTTNTIDFIGVDGGNADVQTAVDELGVWDVALTTREVARLASGRRPKNVA